MKEKYMTPQMEIIVFDVEDIITASGDNSSGSNGPIELPVIKPGWE